MYVSKEAIEEVRRQHDLVTVVQSHGVKLTRKGRNWVGLCPFHDDHEPSLVVNPSRQLWNCFGACSGNGSKRGGDVFTFVAKVEGIPFLAALKKLGYTEPAPHADKGRHPVAPAPKAAAPAASSLPRSGLLQRVAKYYQRVFRDGADGPDYLASRGLSDGALFSALQVGYADGTLRRTLSADQVEALKATGIINVRGRELFAGCVVFPLTLPDEGVVGFYGRHVKRDQHLYLPGPRRGVFHWQAMKGASEVILAESVLDAMTLYQAGMRNVSCVYGTQGLTADHEELLQRFRVQRVLLFLDSDTAGRQATEVLSHRLRRLGLAVGDIKLAGANDPNELWVRLGADEARRVLTGCVSSAHEELGAAESGRAAASGAGTSPPLTVNSTIKEKKEKRGEGEVPNGGGPQVSREPGGGWEVVIGKRTYRVRGLTATGLDRLRVNLRITEGRHVHLDTLDLYSHRSRVALVRELAELFSSDEGEMSRELTTLIDTLERLRLEQGKDAEAPERIEMTDKEREAALRLLRAPDLIARLGADFEALGCVGETTSLTVGYLATVSRLLDEPLGLMIVSRSGAGKSRLQETLCAMVPDESLMRYTRLTGQALFYQEEHALRHKVLAIDEEAGATEAAYSLRTLQSAQVLTVAATRTDPASGKLKTDEYRVEGPVVILFTTTSPEAMDYETRNRFVQVGVDESDEQTRRILARQRQGDTLAGVLGRESASFTASVHQNAQRLLRPLKVVNPYASSLVYPDRSLQMRREQKKYLTLIKTIALLHQHQRPVKKARRGDAEVEYVEVSREDIVLANHLARQVLGRCLDELAPPTRQLLKHLVNLTRGTGVPGTPAPEKRAGGTFTRQDVRRATGWTDWQVRVHLRQLVELEYVVVASGCNGKRMTYELLFDGDPDEDLRYLDGLVDVAECEPAGAPTRQLVRQKATLRGPCEPHSQGRRPLPSVL